MSEARSVSQLTDEITDKTGHEDDFFVLEESVVAGVPITRKIKLSSLLAGLLFPDEFGDIDLNQYSITNANEIEANEGNFLNLNATGNEKNYILPFIRVSLPGTATPAADDSHVLGFGLEASPPVAIPGEYIEIPLGKNDQTFYFSWLGSGIVNLTLYFYPHDRNTGNYGGQIRTQTFGGYAASGLEPFRIFETLTADQDLRIFVVVSSASTFDFTIQGFQ